MEKLRVAVIGLWPHEGNCVLCDVRLYMAGSKALPMYEGRVLPDSWTGPWAGFPVCDTCYAKHRRV